MSKAERLANLVSFLLEVERPVPLRDIVAKVPGYPDAYPSARTQFIRDRDELRDRDLAQIEVHGEGEDAGYRIDPATYYLPDLGLTEQGDARAAAGCGGGAPGGRGSRRRPSEARYDRQRRRGARGAAV